MSESGPTETKEENLGDECGDVCRSHPDLLEFLSSAYEVLRKVFSYLNLEDLGNAAKAYDSWKAAAEVTKRERSIIETFVLSDHKHKMTPIWSEAVFCISFCSAVNKELESEVTRFVRPDGEILSCLATSGVIGSLHDLSGIVQQKIRVGLPLAPKKFFLTSLRFPSLPNVGIKTFVWEEEEDEDFETFKKNFCVPNNKVIKCLLILMVAEERGRSASSHKDDFVSFLRERQKESFAVGGCIIDNFENHVRKNPNHSVVKYVVFYGDNVEAASTVLTADIKTPASIDNKVSELKRKCPETKKGALFIFRCTGRQKVLRRYKMKNDIVKWEGEAILKYFPNTPMVGCFGYGEFGNEHPCDNNVISPNKRIKGSETLEFSFSTSLVYLGFKR